MSALVSLASLACLLLAGRSCSTWTEPGRGMETGELLCLLGPTGMKVLPTEGWAGTSGLRGRLAGGGAVLRVKREPSRGKEESG